MLTALLVIILMVVVFAAGVVLGISGLLLTMINAAAEAVVNGERDPRIDDIAESLGRLIKQRAYKKYGVTIESLDIEVASKLSRDSL